MKVAVPLLLVIVALAGCTSRMATPVDGGGAVDRTLSDSVPSFTKFSLTPADPANVVERVLGDPTVTKTFEVPANTGRMQVAIDMGDPSDRGQPQGDATVALVAPDGRSLFSLPHVTAWQKAVKWFDAPAAGTYSIKAQANGTWKIGVVASFLPLGYTPGITVNISKPTQTRVEHVFNPKTITVPVGVPARVTLFDYDPHYGIDNSQHNWAVPDLSIATDGRTHWGEVFSVTFTPTSTGTFEFQCDYHAASMKGTLVVAAAAS